MKKKFIIFLVLVMALTLIAGCGSEKTVSTKDGSVTFDEGKNKATFEGKDGSKTVVDVADENGKGVALPDGYPEDLVPIVDDSKIQLANKNDENGKTTYLISLSSSKSGKDVYKFYQDVLKDAQDLTSSDMSGIFAVSGVKDNQEISVMITPDEKETMVQIGIVPAD